MNIASLLYQSSQEFGGKTAIIDGGKETSYEELWSIIEKLSKAFYCIGIKDDQRVLLVLPNSSEFIYCFFALLKINVIVTPLSPDLTPYEFKCVFENIQAHAIITIPKLIEKIFGEYPALLDDKIIIMHGEASTENLLQRHYKLSKLYSISENRKDGNIDEKRDHTATISYTYRGYGYPLGAMLTHENYVESVVAYIENTRMSYNHRVLSFLSLSHVYPLVGCVLAPLSCGATIVLSNNYMPRSIIGLIEDLKINYFTAVPSIYRLLMRSANIRSHQLCSLVRCLTGGAYMSREFLEEIQDAIGVEVQQGYGMTECLLIAINPCDNNKRGTLGLPFRDNYLIRIVHDSSFPKGTSDAGEVVVKAPTVMQGYFNQHSETQEVLRDGWLHTGDYGYLDSEKYLHFLGVKKNIAKVGGNLVDLQEVRSVLLSHPMVSNAFVCAKEDKLWGHLIKADISSTRNGELREAEVRFFCGKKLSQYKIPREISIHQR